MCVPCASHVRPRGAVGDENFHQLQNSGKPLAVFLVDPASLPRAAEDSPDASAEGAEGAEGEAPIKLRFEDSTSGPAAEFRSLSREAERRDTLVLARPLSSSLTTDHGSRTTDH